MVSVCVLISMCCNVFLSIKCTNLIKQNRDLEDINHHLGQEIVELLKLK